LSWSCCLLSSFSTSYSAVKTFSLIFILKLSFLFHIQRYKWQDSDIFHILWHKKLLSLNNLYHLDTDNCHIFRTMTIPVIKKSLNPPPKAVASFKLRCDERFTHAFTACSCILKCYYLGWLKPSQLLSKRNCMQ